MNGVPRGLTLIRGNGVPPRLVFVMGNGFPPAKIVGERRSPASPLQNITNRKIKSWCTTDVARGANHS